MCTLKLTREKYCDSFNKAKRKHTEKESTFAEMVQRVPDC